MDPDEPEFLYTRQADYVSGAAMIIDREVWRTVGGFSREFAPAYFEDTDLAFKVRLAGSRVVYAPHSVVVHHEGMTGGTDTSTGMKRYQELNEPLFKAKWADAFARQPPFGLWQRLAADHWTGNGRALMVASSIPSAADYSHGHQAIQEARILQSLGYSVTWAAVSSAASSARIGDSQRIGWRCSPSRTSRACCVSSLSVGPSSMLSYSWTPQFPTG